MSGIKFMGKDNSGKAKAIRTDHNGMLEIKQNKDILKSTKNIFTARNSTKGYSLDTAGELKINASFNVSDYLPIEPATTYTTNKVINICYYDIDKKFITFKGTPIGSFVTPVNSHYYRVSYSKNYVGILQIEKGVTPTYYEPYYDGDQAKTYVENTSLMENPFFTKEGQIVVSPSETFWSRLWRYGRTAYKGWENETLTSNVTTNMAFTGMPNKDFYLKLIQFSADVDCVVRIMVKPIEGFNAYKTSINGSDDVFIDKEVVGLRYLKAGDLFEMNFDGEIKTNANGGSVEIQVTPKGDGVGYGLIRGMEVSEYA